MSAGAAYSKKYGTSSEESLKVCEPNFFEEIYVESSVTWDLPVHIRFTFLMLNMPFDILLSTVFDK